MKKFKLIIITASMALVTGVVYGTFCTALLSVIAVFFRLLANALMSSLGFEMSFTFGETLLFLVLVLITKWIGVLIPNDTMEAKVLGTPEDPKEVTLSEANASSTAEVEIPIKAPTTKAPTEKKPKKTSKKKTVASK